MEKITLTVGDKLIPLFSSTISHFEVLSIDRPNNILKVRCVHFVNGNSHEEKNTGTIWLLQRKL